MQSDVDYDEHRAGVHVQSARRYACLLRIGPFDKSVQCAGTGSSRWVLINALHLLPMLGRYVVFQIVESRDFQVLGTRMHVP